ncbi:MAG: hypothetical protein EOM25_07350 [Deltaproteobacteria bacterium]|nr:hypothetical protein [Deltaproteobacteria bacterium]
MIVILMVVMLSFLSFTFLGAQAFLTRYVSHVGARAYLAYSNGFGDGWKDAVKISSKLIINRSGDTKIETVGDGVRIKVRVRELFPTLGIYGQGGEMELEATTRLGEEPEMEGDNVL